MFLAAYQASSYYLAGLFISASENQHENSNTTFTLPSPKLDHTLSEAIALSLHSSFQGVTFHEVNLVLISW